MKKRMLILLPDGKIHKISVGSLRKSFRESPLTATALAALVPDELDYDITIIDESVQKVPLNTPFDLVAISIITGTAYQAYAYAKHFKQTGATIVLGGVHVTLMPDEAAQHADAIVFGFAEETWPQLLRDLDRNELKPRYTCTEQHFTSIPTPRRDLQKNAGYMIPNVVSATRGCRNKCDFCAVSAANFGWQTRPLPEVMDEINAIKAKRIVFNDVSMGEDMDYFKELLHALKKTGKQWGGLVSTKVFKDPEIPRLLQESGCSYLLIGFESLNNFSLRSINKGFNQYDDYIQIIKTLRQINVVLMGCFIFGFDEDTTDVFANTVDFVNHYQLPIPRYAIYTPYPGTPAYQRFKQEGRLLHENWAYYDTQHVVFQPQNMTPLQLDEGFRWAYNQTFTLSSSFRRTIHSGKNFLLTFGGNLAYRIYLNRLYHEQNRLYIP
jgi:radical SAM superfamily enzyme YgiQ (UPF0313 family)